MPISGFDMLAFIYFIFIIIVTIKIMYYSELNDLNRGHRELSKGSQIIFFSKHNSFTLTDAYLLSTAVTCVSTGISRTQLMKL